MAADMSPAASSSRSAGAGLFRLLVPSTSTDGTDRPKILVRGSPWELTEGSDVPERGKGPEYVCVSYASGLGQTPHPFDDGASMSDRAMAALEATVGALQPTAVWIDALCIPQNEHARAECLRWMGAIYGSASQAVVVLSESCAPALDQIRRDRTVDPEGLLLLERDAWVTRAWTYQELVNVNAVRFVAAGGSDSPSDGDDILNYVGQALRRQSDSEGLDVIQIRTRYPRVDSLENLLLDWKMAGYLQRPVYQVIAAMHGREAMRDADHFHAMVGAISPSPIDIPAGEALHPADYFMRVCEAKGDYSFIYTTGPKSQVPGRRWLPLGTERFRAVLPWHCYGSGQSAVVHSDFIELRDMWCLDPAPVSDAAEEFATKWLSLGYPDNTPGSPSARLLRRLRLAGFTGVGQVLEVGAGYFFSQEPFTDTGDYFVTVATGVRMIHGAPAFLLRRRVTGIHDIVGVGMFVGRVAESAEVVRMG